jgi:cyclopropane fatty-acyl-phospholipid synthase-like methyltransferase
MEWILRNLMGPNPVWLLEAILDDLQIEPGMRVLDLGCGRAVTSIVLAKETGATVFATDLWIDAAGNWDRIREAGARGPDDLGAVGADRGHGPGLRPRSAQRACQ